MCEGIRVYGWSGWCEEEELYGYGSCHSPHPFLFLLPCSPPFSSCILHPVTSLLHPPPCHLSPLHPPPLHSCSFPVFLSLPSSPPVLSLSQCDANPDITKVAIQEDKYENVLTLITYYQMVSFEHESQSALYV